MIKAKLLLSLLLLVTASLFSQPYISFSEKNINYSNRRVNSISGQIFTVTNTGSQPLIINSVSFSSPRFRLDAFDAAFPLTLNPQQTVKLRIWFSPNSASVFNDEAIFSTNAANNSTAKILLSGRGVNVTPNLGDIIWEGTIPDNPCTSLDDFQPKSIKEIPDVNGDGKADIVVATENYWTICYNGNASGSADIIWSFNSCFGTNNTGSVDWEDAMQIMDDINNDGKKEVVIGTGGGNENVYVLSGATGNALWEYGDPIPTNNYTGDINGLRVDKDYNNDGRKDVLVSASGEGATHPGRHSIICLNGLNGQELFVTVIQSEFTHDVATLNLGGAIAFASNGGPYGVKGVNNSGALQWSYSASSTVWSTKQIPDINNDGNTDVVGLYGFAGGIFAISGSNGQQLWTNSLGSSNNGTVEVIGDKDHNGFPDLIFSAPQTAFRIDSKNNQIFWSRPFSSSYIRDAGSLGDVSGDSIDECLFSTQQPGKVFVLDGSNGNILFEYLFGTSIQQRADRVNSLTSIDSNTANEFVACSRDGRIKCFSGGSGTILGISSGTGEIPDKFELYQNYPNPFNPVTHFGFRIADFGFVKIVIYDELGREVRTIVNENLKPGKYEVSFDASDISSGVYYYKLITTGFSETKKMIVVK